jgi:glutathione S-transferase
MPHYTALVTLLAVSFYFFVSTRVAAARRRYGVKLPAITGHPDFERIYRVQMNTLEWMPIFLVSLWLFALYLSDIWAAGLGLAWIGGRVWYFVGYSAATEKRVPGFAVQSLVCVALWLGALVGIVMRLMGP